MGWRNKVETDIDEVVQINTIFTNVSKGQAAKKSVCHTTQHCLIIAPGRPFCQHSALQTTVRSRPFP